MNSLSLFVGPAENICNDGLNASGLVEVESKRVNQNKSVKICALISIKTKCFLAFLLFSLSFSFSFEACAQQVSTPEAALPNPSTAFLKSLVMPGWGHHYVDRTDWNRGQYHLGGEAVLMLSYLGFSIHSGNLRQNWLSYGQAESGVPIKGRSREFQLAVGDFDNLHAYNDYQVRSRNWDRLLDDIPENRWNWDDRETRNRYNSMRSKFERIDRQLPALLVLMGLNRIISGISAYNRARTIEENHSLSAMHFSLERGGVVAHLRIIF